MKILKKLLGAAFGVAVLTGPIAAADPISIVYNFSNTGAFSGDVPPDSDGIYAKATISYETGTNSATIYMQVFDNLVDGAYVNDWFFNLDPTNSFTSLNYSAGVMAKSRYWTQANGYNADGGGYFDLRISFDTANPGQLGQGLDSTYTVTTMDALNADSFNFFSNDKKTGTAIDPREIQGAVHVQGYEGSVWLSACVDGEECEPPPDPCVINPDLPECGGGGQETPEPASLAILGTGLLGLAVARRRRVR